MCNINWSNYSSLLSSTLNMFLFAKGLLLQPHWGTSKNNSTKTFRRLYGERKKLIKEIYGAVSSVHSCQNNWCFVYSRKLKFYGEGLQQRSYSSKVKNMKIYPEIIWYRLQIYINSDNTCEFITKFENVFVCWDNFGGQHPEKFLKVSEIFKKNNCSGVPL